MFDYSRKPVKWQVGNFSRLLRSISDTENCSSILNLRPNRIVVTNGYNERFRGRIVEVANDIANRICCLYNTFINDNNTSYVIQ